MTFIYTLLKLINFSPSLLRAAQATLMIMSSHCFDGVFNSVMLTESACQFTVSIVVRQREHFIVEQPKQLNKDQNSPIVDDFHNG